MVRPETTEIVNSLVAGADELSITRTANVKLPAALGVPFTIPLDEFRVRPGGSTPDTIDHS